MLKILEKLISFKSITPNDDGLIEFLNNYLSDLGCKVIVKYFGDDKVQVGNIYATYGSKGENLCFAGHIDVVEPGDLSMWKYDPFILTKENENLYGRGVIDMKGSIACMLETIKYWIENNHNEKVSILITADEEGDAKFGTKKMLEYLGDIGEKIDFTIVGEPTCEENLGDIVKIGRRGSANFNLTVEGVQGHVAYPDKAVNPNTILIKILNMLLDYKFDNGSENFISTNLEITSIDVGNSTTNIIPNSASAKFNIRFSDKFTSFELYQKIHDLIENIYGNFNLEYTCNAESFLSQKVEFTYEVAQIIESVTAIKPQFSTSGGTSDARFIYKYSPLLEFGLLNDTAHKINENCKISDLQNLQKIYTETLKNFHFSKTIC